MCIIKNHDSPDAPSVHLRFSQARQHVVDFVHSYRLCLALPNPASLSLLVSLYYIPTMCGKYLRHPCETGRCAKHSLGHGVYTKV